MSENIQYDRSVDAGYIYMQDARHSYVQTVEVADGVNIDFGVGGRVLGIEILSPSTDFIKLAEKK